MGMKIDFDRFVADFMSEWKVCSGTIYTMVENALEAQGLEYRDGEIVEKKPPLKIEEGKWYGCTKTWRDCERGEYQFVKGELFKADFSNVRVQALLMYGKNYEDFLRPATMNEILGVKQNISPKYKAGDVFIMNGSKYLIEKVGKYFYECTKDGEPKGMASWSIQRQDEFELVEPLNEFERAYLEKYHKCKQEEVMNWRLNEIRKEAKELLELARKQLEKDVYEEAEKRIKEHPEWADTEDMKPFHKALCDFADEWMFADWDKVPGKCEAILNKWEGKIRDIIVSEERENVKKELGL